ncbi:MAG: metal ABC transporter substrate-binding protein [Bdellovibrionota bacterium]
MIFKIFYAILIFFVMNSVQAKVSILTTTANLKAIAQEVGGDKVSVYSFCKGSQDPHYLEAKPSYMLKTNRSDLIVAVGLGLEEGWLPRVLAGGRNANVMPGKNGYLEVGTLLDVIEVATKNTTRAEGDVHPQGNPHVTLDPIRVGLIAEKIAERLALLDQSNATEYKKRALALKARLSLKLKEWEKRVKKTGIEQVVSYHKTFNYFFDRFSLKNPAILEPLPGVPPTAAHIVSVINKIVKNGVRLILVENYFDESVAKRVARDVKGIRVESVPVSVGGREDIQSIDDLFENIVKSFEKQ